MPAVSAWPSSSTASCRRCSARTSHAATSSAFSPKAEPKVEIEHINDWEGSEYRYCNEFLVHSETLDPAEALDFLATMGDCELCVGTVPRFKVHVHSNHPNKVLEYFLERGQIFEVFIHNMDLQSIERNDKLVAEQEQAVAERKPFGIVGVAAGEGNAKIMRSLGVDVIVSGGQTMNPSTADLLEAVVATNADNVIILPNNSNIIMAANSAAELAEVECGVVPTKSVPQAFAALFGYDANASLEDNIESMTEAYADVKTGEVTTAIKDSHDANGNPIAEGDVIGIADGSIDAVGSTIEDVVMGLLEAMDADDADTCTLLAGEDYSDEQLDALVERIEERYDDLEIDAHRGEQPLYPDHLLGRIANSCQPNKAPPSGVRQARGFLRWPERPPPPWQKTTTRDRRRRRWRSTRRSRRCALSARNGRKRSAS